MQVLSQSTVFEYPNTDPYDRGNLYGFSHAPSVTRLPDGRLMAASHSIFRSSEGRLVLTHDECAPPARSPLTVRVSDDDGETWAEPFTLAEISAPGTDDDAYTRQVTYPSVAELSDRSLFVVWAEISISGTEQVGKIRGARLTIE